MTLGPLYVAVCACVSPKLNKNKDTQTHTGREPTQQRDGFLLRTNTSNFAR